MKKTLIVALVIVACMALTSGYALAVSGMCSNCHTMHNSQGGSPMTFDSNATPNPVLLRGSCLGCHAQGGTDTIITTGGASVPQVNPTGAAGVLAGGTFAYGNAAGQYAQAHNPVGASNTLFIPDGTLANNPPGGPGNFAGTLSCAGTSGCHGVRTTLGSGNGGNDMNALSGAHHGNNGTGGSIQTTTSVGNSYRFLNGIYGYEETLWENAPDASTHNQYYAVNDVGDSHTISSLCAQCHGLFHAANTAGTNTMDASGEWIRHPTDHVIPSTGEYASAFNSGAATGYDPVVPTGSSDVSAIKNASVPGTDMVVCVSCHRAHGSNQPDLLRWNYSNMVANTTGAGAGTGCFKCHTQKDG